MKGTKRICSLVLIGAMAGSMTMPECQTEAAKKKPKLNKKSVTLQVGKSITLKLKNNKKKVKWTTSDKKVAKVNKKGKVTAVAAGRAKITAKVAKKKYHCNIRVEAVKKSGETPAAASITKKVKNNYAKLKSYIMAKGMIGDAGNKGIHGKYGDNYTVAIAYDAINKAFVFESKFDYMSGDNVHITNKTKMVISETNFSRAALENSAYVGSYDAVLKSEMEVSEANGESDPAWTTLIANPDDGSIDWVDFAKNRWGMAYAGWRLLLLDTLSFDMEDLGFREI